MTVPVGFRPDRVEALDLHTRIAIGHLRHLHAGDPAAADAMRSIRATVQMLEDHWMPLISAIRASDAMLSWTRAALDAVGAATWLTQWRTLTTPHDHLASLSDDELIAEIFRADQLWAATPRWFEDPDLGYGNAEALLHAVEQRVATDSAFGELLADTAGDIDVLLLFFARGAFPTDLVADVTRAAVGRPDHVGVDGLRRALLTDALLGRIADDPAAALDLLADVDVAAQIIAFDDGLDIWVNRPATPGVAALIHAGLVGAPTETPDRRADGFDAFGWFIDRANDLPVDRDGFPPGVAAGLAVAMQHYVPTFIDSIDSADDEDGLISGVHADRDGDGLVDALASYEEMTDFFGALVTDTDAVSLLGVLLTATADDVAYERTTLSHAAHLAGLLRDAARNEQREAALAAAARTAQQGQIIGVLASATKAATGIGGPAKAVFDVSTNFVTTVARTTTGGDSPIEAPFNPGALTRHLVQMAMIRRLATDTGHRRTLGIDPAPEAWSDVAMRLDELDHLANSDAPRSDVQTARQRIFNRVRELGGGPIIDSLDGHGTLASLPNGDVAGD